MPTIEDELLVVCEFANEVEECAKCDHSVPHDVIDIGMTYCTTPAHCGHTGLRIKCS